MGNKLSLSRNELAEIDEKYNKVNIDNLRFCYEYDDAIEYLEAITDDDIFMIYLYKIIKYFDPTDKIHKVEKLFKKYPCKIKWLYTYNLLRIRERVKDVLAWTTDEETTKIITEVIMNSDNNVSIFIKAVKELSFENKIRLLKLSNIENKADCIITNSSHDVIYKNLNLIKDIKGVEKLYRDKTLKLDENAFRHFSDELLVRIIKK